MGTTEEAIAALAAEVARTATVVDSAKVLITGLRDQLEAAKDDPEQIQAIIDQLDTKNDELAAAVAEPPVEPVG